MDCITKTKRKKERDQEKLTSTLYIVPMFPLNPVDPINTCIWDFPSSSKAPRIHERSTRVDVGAIPYLQRSMFVVQ